MSRCFSQISGTHRILEPAEAACCSGRWLSGNATCDESSGISTATNGWVASHLQMGHSGLREDSHWSMHSMWKRCLHGSTRSLLPSLHAHGSELQSEPPLRACTMAAVVMSKGLTAG